MPRILDPILARLRRKRAKPAAESGASTAERRLNARALADAIDRAMDMGLWGHAERIARTATALAPESPRLGERLARLRLAQGDPETALSVIDGYPTRTASLRMLRAACLVQLGRKEEAHSDLHRWSKKSASPMDARLMLALLEWESGDDHAATLGLLRNLRHMEDPRTLELLLLIAVGVKHDERAQAWVERLREASAYGAGSPYLRLLCYSLGLPRKATAEEPTERQANLLAMELIGCEQVIPSLVEAQRLRPQPETADLLYRAVEMAMEDLTDEVRAIEALARLAVVLGNFDTARQWAETGLERNPMSASLAMLARQLSASSDEASEYDGPSVLRAIGPLTAKRDSGLPQEKAA